MGAGCNQSVNIVSRGACNLISSVPVPIVASALMSSLTCL
ncbi:hypothetical protein ACP4OV_023700 [Aristida adscensionis]